MGRKYSTATSAAGTEAENGPVSAGMFVLAYHKRPIQIA
jgi:hypothetical protein